MSLGRNIRERREEIGMSQAYLASCASLSQGYLSQIENDDVQNPSASVLFRLAQSLHINPHCLLEAAGYRQGVDDNGRDNGFDTAVDPDLLAFLARLVPEQQRYLLRLLEGMEKRATADVRARRDQGRVTSKS